MRFHLAIKTTPRYVLPVENANQKLSTFKSRKKKFHALENISQSKKKKKNFFLKNSNGLKNANVSRVQRARGEKNIR